MPETQVASGAPQTATPPAPSGSGGVFDNLALPPEEAPPTPPVAPEAPETPLKVEEPLAPEGKPASEEPPKPTPPVAAPPKLYAGRFTTPEHLEIAYDESSKEGRRLAGLLKNADATAEALQEKLEELELQSQLGSFKELTPEELKALHEQDALKAAEYLAQLNVHKSDKARMERELKERQKQAKREDEIRIASIEAKAESMERDVQNFPNFKVYQPLMDQIMNRVPEISGHKWSPEIIYYAAAGYVAAQAAKQSASQSEESRKKAEEEARAQAQRAGSSGPTGTNSAPPGGEGDSDEAFNKRLQQKAPKPLFQF